MKRLDKDGKRRKLDIKFIYKKDGTKLEEILKEGYLCYLFVIQNVLHVKKLKNS